MEIEGAFIAAAVSIDHLEIESLRCRADQRRFNKFTDVIGGPDESEQILTTLGRPEKLDTGPGDWEKHEESRLGARSRDQWNSPGGGRSSGVPGSLQCRPRRRM